MLIVLRFHKCFHVIFDVRSVNKEINHYNVSAHRHIVTTNTHPMLSTAKFETEVCVRKLTELLDFRSHKNSRLLLSPIQDRNMRATPS